MRRHRYDQRVRSLSLGTPHFRVSLLFRLLPSERKDSPNDPFSGMESTEQAQAISSDYTSANREISNEIFRPLSGNEGGNATQECRNAIFN